VCRLTSTMRRAGASPSPASKLCVDVWSRYATWRAPGINTTLYLHSLQKRQTWPAPLLVSVPT
jgi:hypothetical protein